MANRIRLNLINLSTYYLMLALLGPRLDDDLRAFFYGPWCGVIKLSNIKILIKDLIRVSWLVSKNE